MEALGPLVSSHGVDNRQRWVVGGAAAVIGAVAAALMLVLVLHPVFSRAAGKFAAMMLIGIVVGFGVAAAQLTKALRGGPAERYDVHERGIAHVSRRGHRSWRWDQVRWLRVKPGPAAFEWMRRFGWDFTCCADLTDGASIQFNGLTADAPSIAEVLRAHCPRAIAWDGEIHRWHVWRWVLPFLALFFGSWVVVGYLWLNEDHSVTVDHGGWSEEFDPFDDSTYLLAATGVGCCFIGFVASVTYLFTSFRAQLNRRSGPAPAEPDEAVLAGPLPTGYAMILVGDVLRVPGMETFADDLDREALDALAASVEGLGDEEVAGTIRRSEDCVRWEPHPAFARIGVRGLVIAREDIDLIVHPGPDQDPPVFAILLDDCESELDFRIGDLALPAED
ncbi:hypothetical protein REH65_08265 [Saccharopolyspora sp. ID03-671]|uniref:hypothetical protein n=1 Tax=Saccharopolyspora sp. ID03-671 TaxID=3073066 RepID=UPI003254570C